MKIKYRTGDVFTSDVNVIVHGCNAQGVMGSGVAAIIRRDYPKAYQAYLDWHNEDGLLLGEIQAVEIAEHRTIINAITQNLYGRTGDRFVSYDAVTECMQKINRYCISKNHKQVAMPQIGAGLGGGKWDIIERIIETELTDVGPIVYVF